MNHGVSLILPDMENDYEILRVIKELTDNPGHNKKWDLSYSHVLFHEVVVEEFALDIP